MKRLHLHLYNDSINTNNLFTEYSHGYLESIMLHTSFLNVSAQNGNNVLYYTSTSFVTLQDGYYNLQTLNKILRGVGSLYFKLILADNSQYYRLVRYANLNDWNSELTVLTDYTNDVKDKTPLNISIYSGRFFNGLKCRMNFLNELTSQNDINQIIYCDEVEFPITAPAFSQQWLYFNPPIEFLADVTNSIQIQFADWDNRPIKFNTNN